LGGEEEGGAVDLLSSSERQGEARNSGAKQQPWWFELVTGSMPVRKRERPRRKGGRRPGRKRGGGVVQGVSRRSFSVS
jgi:hypothetical protein